MEKKCGIFIAKRLHFSNILDYIWTWALHLKKILDCVWTWTVLKNQDWIWIAKYDSPLISAENLVGNPINT